MGLHLASGALGFVEARSEFRRAHARARLRGILSRILRRCARLCSLVDAAAEIAAERIARGGQCAAGSGAGSAFMTPGRTRLTDVALDRVIGSVDRANDYTPDFLPLLSSDEERWARVLVAVESLEGVPPVDLYEVDGEYYVKDGHHRVSVLKRMGVRSVEAYVTTLITV